MTPETHPVIPNPITFRLRAALPAAGAWDAAPLELAVAGFRYVTLFVSYIEGAAGGQVNFQPQYSPYDADASAPAGSLAWVDASIYAAGAVVAGANTTSNMQGEDITFDPVGAAQEGIPYGPMELQGTIQRMRIPAREVGVVGTPGIAEIIGVGCV
jgi:hypothetical protein